MYLKIYSEVTGSVPHLLSNDTRVWVEVAWGHAGGICNSDALRQKFPRLPTLQLYHQYHSRLWLASSRSTLEGMQPCTSTAERHSARWAVRCWAASACEESVERGNILWRLDSQTSSERWWQRARRPWRMRGGGGAEEDRGCRLIVQETKFDERIKRFDDEMGLWCEKSDEWIDSTTGGGDCLTHTK